MSDAPTPDTGLLRQELETLLLDTNDARRRLGQALYHFYRTLVFWQRRGLDFARITAIWAPAAADLLGEMGRTLARRPQQGVDARMRAYAADVLERLAHDLERGDAALPLFLSYMETRFPMLTALMREVDPAQPVHDGALMQTLAEGLGRAARSSAAQRPPVLRETAQDLRMARPRTTQPERP